MRYYVNKKDLNDTLNKITADQIKKKTFYNVSVKEYKGSKYPADTVVVKIG